MSNLSSLLRIKFSSTCYRKSKLWWWFPADQNWITKIRNVPTWPKPWWRWKFIVLLYKHRYNDSGRVLYQLVGIVPVKQVVCGLDEPIWGPILGVGYVAKICSLTSRIIWAESDWGILGSKAFCASNLSFIEENNEISTCLFLTLAMKLQLVVIHVLNWMLLLHSIIFSEINCIFACITTLYPVTILGQYITF